MEKQSIKQQKQYLQNGKQKRIMQSAAENSKTWNKLVDWYDQTFMHDTRYQHCYDRFLELLGASESSVLEIGCGPGNIAKYMLDSNSNLKWTGIDYAPAMVERATENCPQAQFSVLDGREVKAWRNKFDALMLGFCLPYFSPAELCDVLPAWLKRVNAGGLVYLSFVEGDPARSGTHVNGNGDAIDFYYYTSETIEQALKDCSATVVFSDKIIYPKAENKTEVHSIMLARCAYTK